MSTWSKAKYQSVCLLNWTKGRLLDVFRKLDGPTHIFFCTADHFEPGTAGGGVAEERARMECLLKDYPRLADRHRDSDNLPLRRTWFFPPHYHRRGNLKDLVSLCAAGYGEIELHLHHGKEVPDTEENLRETISRTIREYSLFGIFGSEGGKKRYGFVHGDWALCNSRDNRYCGVDRELVVLQDTGCYGDFTFPAMGVPNANPHKPNSIYYARHHPGKSRSHVTGREVSKGGKDSGDLMIVQGCVHPYCWNGNLTGWRLIGDELGLGRSAPTPQRVDSWVRTGVHVSGKRNWVFIKTHTHGAVDAPSVTGKPMDDALSHLESHYNDGKQYFLHYVTARELYNIAKAAEAGEPGDDPNLYRNYMIDEPRYDTSVTIAEASAELQALVAKTYRG